MLLSTLLGCLALLSLVLMLWQWFVALRFPLHERMPAPSFCPPVTLLKPLKGSDETTEGCLRSWLAQTYPAQVQVLFGVATADDPVCETVRRVLREDPARDARLVVCGPLRGANLKVSKLAELERLATHDLLIISDADVWAPPDLVANLVALLQPPEVGLVNCFYRLANPVTWAMRWEAVAINADFWSQVLQARSLKPMDFALGAVMATRRRQLAEIGGFAALANCLADDYQLGHRIARRGYGLALSSVVVECRSTPLDWAAVWKHQLRWARTIRVCQPAPYFFSILSNPTLWPMLFLAAHPTLPTLLFGLGCWTTRWAATMNLQSRLERGHSCSPGAASCESADRNVRPPVPAPSGLWLRLGCAGFAFGKDLLQMVIWLLAFTGSRVEWRGEKLRLRRDGTLVRDTAPEVTSP